jgi:hypothetical protein
LKLQKIFKAKRNKEKGEKYKERLKERHLFEEREKKREE